MWSPIASYNITPTPTMASHLSTQPSTTHRATHHDLPPCRLPAASILQVSAIAVRRTIDHNLCYKAMQFSYTKLNVLLFYWLLFCRPLINALVNKRYVFLLITCHYFSGIASNQCTLTPAIHQYLFCWCHLSPDNHVLAWFGMRAGSHCLFTAWGMLCIAFFK